jgi:hypothetical protein
MKMLDCLCKYLHFMPIIVIIVCFGKKICIAKVFVVCEMQGSDNAVAEDSHWRCDTVSSGERFPMF